MAETLESTLHAYLDGALTGPALTAFEKRLAEPKVAARLAELKSLRAAMSAAAPLPTAEQSKRMWAAIRAQVGTQEARATLGEPALSKRADPGERVEGEEPWYGFLTKPWTRGFSFGLVGAAAAVAVVLLLQPAKQAPLPLDGVPRAASGEAASADASVSASNASLASAPASAPAAGAASEPKNAADAASAAPMTAHEKAVAASAAMEEAMGKSERPAMAAAPAPARARKEPTEVERALADNQVDDLIDAFLQARRSQPGPSLAAAPAMKRSAAYGGGATLAGYSNAPAAELEAVDSRSLGAALGGPDHNGFWDWHPAAIALNQRNWSQARAELESASSRAGEPVERAFAASALTLLSAPGGPLEGTQPLLPSTGDLRVLGAGRWQLQVDTRLARFSAGVSARLPGFRVEGDSLLLDLTFDRGTFSPGTRFTRVAGEAPARVLDAASQEVDSAQFSAPGGAVYNVHERELRLR